MEGRLSVSTKGMRELHAARPAWYLVKELVQNAWDEAPEATVCSVKIGPLMHRGKPKINRTVVVVEDDGSGFRDIKDAYTLMAPTPKRSDPSKRGRFNIGEKELLSVCVDAEIETVGYNIIFPKDGGRRLRRNDRKRGTVVTLTMPWGQKKRDNAITMLLRFQPPADCRLIVNGAEVERRESVTSRRARLATILQNAPDEPMRNTSRFTDIEIIDPAGEASWLYEMGIPVQETDLAFDVDIQQKVPMPPNRDTVAKGYLRDVSAEVLNATHGIMEPEDFAESWVRTAIEDERIESETVQRTIKGRYGNRVAIWSKDRDANMKAAEAGYEVLHPRSMSPEERDNMRKLGDLQSTKALFGKQYGDSEPVDEPNETQQVFAEWVKELGRRCGLTVTVRFFRMPNGERANCSGATGSPDR